MLDNKNIEIFASRDKIRLQLLNLARNYLKLENFDFTRTSYLSYLIDIISILTSNLMYYNTSVYREQFLTKAVQRESVLALSRMIGYIPKLAKPSQVKVFMQIPLGNLITQAQLINIQLIGRNHIFEAGEDIDKPVHKVYAGPITFSLKNSIIISIQKGIPIVYEQLVYENSNGVHKGWKTLNSRINAGKLELIATFEQIEDIIDSYTVPLLQPYEFYNLKINFKKSGYLSDVSIFAVSSRTTSDVLQEWIPRDSLFLLDPNEYSFSYRERENGVLISFGNGVLGKQPEANSNLLITSGITLGDQGNVISGTITNSDPVAFEISLAGTGSNATYSNTITPRVINREPAIGGEDPPSIDEIRSESIKSVSMNNRLVSANDFKNLTTIISDLPSEKYFEVLKRSDLKRNEITLFTDIIFDNFIVPTKNLYLDYVEVPSEDNLYQIPANTIINEDPTDPNSDEYITLFDIILDKNKKECLYYYYIDKLELPTTLIRTVDELMTFSKQDLIPTTTQTAQALPVYANIYSDRLDPLNEELHIELYTNILNTSKDYIVVVTIPMTNQSIRTQYVLNSRPLDNSGTGSPSIGRFTTQAIYDTSSIELYPKVSIPLKEILEDKIQIKFSLYQFTDNTKFSIMADDQLVRLDYISRNRYLDSSGNPINIINQTATVTPKIKLINESKIDTFIKKNLTDFMYSQVQEIDTSSRGGTHSADLDKNFKISAEELNYVIDYYNAGAYHYNPDSITGYSPGIGSRSGPPHSADWRGGADWVISSQELLDVIKIFNAGGYHVTLDGEEDLGGFALGYPNDLDNPRAFKIFDIPTINKNYYINLFDKSEFTRQVLQKISSFDVYQYKMMTDFVNLKFANTGGKSRNMKYNEINRGEVYTINPPVLPTPTELNTRYAVSDNNHPWIRYYKDQTGGNPANVAEWVELQKWNRPGGFIATNVEYIDIDNITRTGWTFETLKPNDIVKILNLHDELDQGITQNDILIYNGNNIVKPEFNIPLELYIIVFADPNSTTTDEIIRQSVIDSVINEFANKFNYQISLYRSEIIKVVQSVPGVKSCDLVKPSHDIFFNFDPVQTLTQEELIRYTPELIYFGSENIQVEVRS